MSNFKAKLAFFQNATLQQQQIRQTPFHQTQIQQHQQFSSTRQTQKASNDASNLPYMQKVNPTTPISSSTDSQFHSCAPKPAIVVPKMAPNSNFKSKLAFFNQQPAPLAHLHPHQNDVHSQKNDCLSAYNRENNIQSSFTNNDYCNTEKNNLQSSISSTNNENIPQPVNTEYKTQQLQQPAKSFKDKLAMLSNIQQPMGVYDYKKKFSNNQQKVAGTSIQTFTESSTQNFPDTSSQFRTQSPLPSLAAGRARRTTRRPPSLDQSDTQQSSLPPSS